MNKKLLDVENIFTIFIMLGSSCNLRCRYCLQQCQDIPQLPSEINPDIYAFIRNCINTSQNGRVRLLFYGGEPTIYIKQIEKIVAEMAKEHAAGKIEYGMISNGRAITQEMADYFNANDISVTISWDGNNSSKTRLYSAFETNRDNLLRIEGLGVSGVLSADNYLLDWFEDVDELNEEYHKIHGYDVSVNIDYIFDTGIADKKLIDDIDYERLEQEAAHVAKGIINPEIQIGYAAKKWGEEIGMDILKHHTSDMAGKEIVKHAPCRNGYNVLNMDLAGNLYECHNIFDNVSSIYDSYDHYISLIKEGDNCRKINDGCQGCIAFPICHGGCKLLTGKTKDSYCNIRKHVVNGFFKGIKKG